MVAVVRSWLPKRMSELWFWGMYHRHRGGGDCRGTACSECCTLECACTLSKKSTDCLSALKRISGRIRKTYPTCRRVTLRDPKRVQLREEAEGLRFAVLREGEPTEVPSGFLHRRELFQRSRSPAIWKIAATRNQRTKKQRDKVPQSFQLSLPRCCFNRQRGLFLFTCIRCQPAIRGGGVGSIGQKGCSSNAGSKFVQVALELTTSSIQAKGGP